MSFIAVTVDPDCGISDTDGYTACVAVDAQAKEFSDAHGCEYLPVVFFSSDVLAKLDGDELSKFVAEARLCTVQTKLDVPNALGFHDDVAGVEFARVGAGPDWTVTLSHEVLELTLDPTCDEYTPLGEGREQAKEACDRVEGDTYRQGDTRVSNYLLPAAFEPGSDGPWDRLKQLTTWDGLTGGGYMIVRNADGSETEVDARTPRAEAHFAAKKARPDSRVSRRLAAVVLGQTSQNSEPAPKVEKKRARRAV